MGRPNRKNKTNKTGGGGKRVAGTWDSEKGTGTPEERISREQRWSNDKDSVKFNEYYKGQKIIPEEEWDEFIKACQTTLPTTFRITGSRSIAPSLHSMIQTTFVPHLTGLSHDSVPLSPPHPLKWYPNEWAWQLNISKVHIRKNEQFRKFQNFLVYETDAGNISRQEAVSMIPPLLLDVKPEHHVLDMCAAPGSKSVQLLEALHTYPSTSPNSDSKRIPPGLLLANDSDPKRCHMLVHQSLHRIPAAGMAVTNHDATQLPGLRIPIEEGDSTKDGRKWKALLFDRILADVPCSGDGTLRKNPSIWKEWTPGNGVGLHALQLRILMRGLALLKPGGKLVYSTCSLNPVENEAVVSAALEATPDLKIVPVPDMLSGLIRRPGLTTWNVLTNEMTPAPRPSSSEPTTTTSEYGKRKIWASTLWPNGKEEERGLVNCLRIYPHLQDTGGFFVCVLQKDAKADGGEEKEPEVEAEEEEKVVEEPAVRDSEKEEMTTTGETLKRTSDEVASSPSATEPAPKRVKVDEVTVPEVAEEVVAEVLASVPAEIGGATTKKGKGHGDFKEEPFIYLSAEDEQVKLCLEFFDLTPDFPVSSLLVRNSSGSALRSIYFTSPIVRTLLQSNSYTRMRLISCGVKLFSRQDSSKDGTYRCRWRVMSDGLEILRPFMGPRRIVQASVETLKVLMGEMNVNNDKLEEVAFKERLKEMENGSCVLEVIASGKDIALEQKLILPLWRSPNSVTLMVEKVEKSALSLRLFGEDITPHAPKAKAPRTGVDPRDAAKKAVVVEAVDVEGDEKAEEVMDRAEEMLATESKPTVEA